VHAACRSSGVYVSCQSVGGAKTGTCSAAMISSCNGLTKVTGKAGLGRVLCCPNAQHTTSARLKCLHTGTCPVICPRTYPGTNSGTCIHHVVHTRNMCSWTSCGTCSGNCRRQCTCTFTS